MCKLVGMKRTNSCSLIDVFEVMADLPQFSIFNLNDGEFLSEVGTSNSSFPKTRAMDSDSRAPFSAAASVLPTTEGEASSSTRRLTEWPTIDGPLGLSHEESVTYAGRFFKLGFLCLPFLWAVNCFYFWPVLRHPHFHQSHPRLRRCKSRFRLLIVYHVVLN